jgi:hypothetical protein
MVLSFAIATGIEDFNPNQASRMPQLVDLVFE